MKSLRKETTVKATRRIECEQLEDRRYLSLVASITDGDLLVTGEAHGTVEIRAVDDGKFEIVDGGETVGTVEGVTDDIRIALDAHGNNTDDRVLLKLNGQAVDQVFVQLGNGSNAFELSGGTLRGALRFLGGTGDDTLTIAEDAVIEGRVVAQLKSGDNQMSVSGEVHRQLLVLAGPGDDVVEVEETAMVAGNAYLMLGDGQNLSSLAGEIDGDFFVAGGDDADVVTILDSALVAGSLHISTGNGDNVLDLAGLVMGSVHFAGGSGDDTVTIGSTAVVTENVSVRLGKRQTW